MLELFRIAGRIDLEGGDKTSRELDQIEGKGKKAAGGIKNFAKGVGKVAAGIGVFALVSKGIDMVRQSIDGAIERYDTLNQFPRVLQMIGFDAEETDAAINRLSDGIDGLPTTLDSVAKTAQNIAVMTGDLDGATETTLALNNAFLASGSSSADASRGLDQYVQMLSKGEVDLQSWRTLQETMGVALSKLAEEFGFTGESAQNDLYDALKSGEVTFDEFNSKLIEASEAQGGFSDMASEASGGIKTSWSNMKTAIVKGVADVVGSIDKALGGTGKIENILDKMKNGVKVVFSWISTQIPRIRDVIDTVKNKFEEWRPTINRIKDAFQPFIERIQGSFDTLKGHLTPIWEDLKQLFDSLKPVLEVVGAAIVVMYGIWLSVFSGAVAAIGPLINAVVNFVDFVVNMVNFVIALLTGDFSGAWEYWQKAGQSAFDFFMNLFNTVIDFLATFIDTIIDYFKGLYNTLVGNSIIPDMVNAIIDWFVNLYEAAVEWVSDLVAGVVEFFTDLYNKASAIFETFWVILTDIWSYIEDTFQNALDFLLALVTGDFEGMKDAMKNQMDNAKNLLSNIWERIKGFIGEKAAEILSNIINKFIEIKNNMQDKINEAKDAVIKKLADMVRKVTTKGQEIVDTVKRKFNDAKEKILSPIESAKETISGIVEDIKGFFSGMKLKIPKPKVPSMPSLPQPKISGSFSLKPPSVPKISWNALGGIFKKPTIFNTANAGLQGVGEAGSEAILPLNAKTLGGIGAGIARTMEPTETDLSMRKVESLLIRLIEAVKDGKIIQVDGRVLGEITDDEQGKRVGMNGRRVAY